MDSSNFERAEIYLKEILSIPIELTIKDLNRQLENDRIVPGLKLIVTGGQAIQSYFPNSPQLRTHDYDLKLVSPKNVAISSRVKNRMLLLGRGATRYLDIVLNNYIEKLLPKLKGDIQKKYGLELIDNNGKVFTSTTNLKNNQLNILTFKLTDGSKIRTNSMIDIYVVDPKEISEHYYTFTGMEGSNPILSQDAGDYYIPIKYVNGVPYAGMGYIVWDTYRMVADSLERGSVKYPRYAEKRDAILHALNNPTSNVSCDALKDYVNTCEKNYKECTIRGRRYRTVTGILRYALSEGVIPSDAVTIRRIMGNYDLNYVCEAVKRMIE